MTLPSPPAGSEEASTLSNSQERSFRAAALSQSPVHIEDEIFCRQRNRIVLGSRVPYVACDVFIASNAIVVGDVDMFDRVSQAESALLVYLIALESYQPSPHTTIVQRVYAGSLVCHMSAVEGDSASTRRTDLQCALEYVLLQFLR